MTYTITHALAGKGRFRLSRRCKTYGGRAFGNYTLTEQSRAQPLAGGDLQFFMRNWDKLTTR